MTQTDYDAAHLRLVLKHTACGLIADSNSRGECALVRDDLIVGTEWQQTVETSHSDVVGISAAGEAAHGATVCMTLESCYVSCTDTFANALTEVGIARIVFAQTDPNSVAHGGAEVLHARGFYITDGVLADETAALNSLWTFGVTHGHSIYTLEIRHAHRWAIGRGRRQQSNGGCDRGTQWH